MMDTSWTRRDERNTVGRALPDPARAAYLHDRLFFYLFLSFSVFLPRQSPPGVRKEVVVERKGAETRRDASARLCASCHVVRITHESQFAPVFLTLVTTTDTG